MLILHDLTVSYKMKRKKLVALENLDACFPMGKITVVIGPSGCGKSTLLYTMAGIVKDYKGMITFNGKDISQEKLKIGYIPQNYGLLPWKTIRDNILLSRKLSGGEKSIEYDEIINGLSIENIMLRYPHEVSGGQKQRAAIARAFVSEPDILLMDEPFSALDAITREEAQDMFLKIWQKKRATAVFITHSVEEAAYLGNSIVIMASSPGRVIETVDNPMFGVKDARVKREFYDFQLLLREKIKKEWSK